MSTPGSLARWAVGWVATVLVVWLAAATALSVTTIEMRRTQHRQSTVYEPARQDVLEAFNDFVDQESGLRGFMLTSRELFLQPYQDAQRRSVTVLARLRSTTTAVPSTAGPLQIATMAADVAAMRDRLLADADAAEQALHALRQHSPAVAALRQALVPSTAAIALRLKHALAAALRAGAGQAGAVTTVSRSLADVPDELFATVLIVAIDTRENELVYVNAGHPAALLLAQAPQEALDPGQYATSVPGGEGPARTWTELPPTGPLLSPAVASGAWNQVTRPFVPGDTLLAFTDGLLEARDDDGEQFGLRRVLDVLTRQDPTSGPRLLDALAAAVLRHHPSRRDDQTLVYAHRSHDAAATTSSAAPGTASVLLLPDEGRPVPDEGRPVPAVGQPGPGRTTPAS